MYEARRKMLEKYHGIKQYDITDCRAACLATISKQYGLRIPITKIREAAGTDKRGTNAYGVLQGNMSVGSLITFNPLLAYFIGSMKNIINLQPGPQTAIVAEESLGRILDLDIEVNEHGNKKIVPCKYKGNIGLENIDFRYGTRQSTLIGKLIWCFFVSRTITEHFWIK